MDKKVTIQIVTYNSAQDIVKCLDSIKEQTFKNIEIIVIDNKSTDQTVDLLRKKHNDIQLIINKRNLGFCIGHNIGLRRGTGEYVLVLNPDIVLDKYFVEIVVQSMEYNPKVGLISGKLLRMMPDFLKTSIIDSTGIIMPKNRRAFDRGQGEEDHGQYDLDQQIFGVCGAAAFYRRTMLKDIKVGNEFFDENFFAYKEDVDLSWRAKNLGWESLYVPNAIAYHKRGWKQHSREDMPHFLKVHSIKNRYLMIVKNENIAEFLKNLPYIAIFDLGVFAYCLFREPKTLKYIPSTIGLLYDTIKKRKTITNKIKRNKSIY